jgi:hypothetical protein
VSRGRHFFNRSPAVHSKASNGVGIENSRSGQLKTKKIVAKEKKESSRPQTFDRK